jgi:hypothetical protein
MRKAIIAAVAATIAIGPAPLLAASGEKAHAYPGCDQISTEKGRYWCEQQCDLNKRTGAHNAACGDEGPGQAPPN